MSLARKGGKNSSPFGLNLRTVPRGRDARLTPLTLARPARHPCPVKGESTFSSAWLADNGRRDAEKIAAELNPAGYAVAGVSIRSSSQAQFPAQLHDIKGAIRWLRANAKKYNLAPERVAIMGDSSGGWTSAMAAVTGNDPALDGNVGVSGPSSAVQAAIPFYPPTDFLQMDAHMPDNCEEFNAIMGTTGCHSDPRSPESRLLGCTITQCPPAEHDLLPEGSTRHALRNAQRRRDPRGRLRGGRTGRTLHTRPPGHPDLEHRHLLPEPASGAQVVHGLQAIA